VNIIRYCISAWKSEKRSHRIALTVVFLAGVGFRLAFLFQPMMHDETVNYLYFAAKPLSYGLSHYPYPNNHLLNTFLMHFTTRVLGSDPWAIRLPAFLAGVLLIPATYIVVRKLYNRDAGLLAAALVASSSLLIEYSTDARGFAIQGLLFMLLILVTLRLMRSFSTGWWITFAVLGALGFYTTPTMLFFFGGLVLWMLLSALAGDTWASKGRSVVELALAVAFTALLTFLLYLPVVRNSGISSLTSNQWVTSLSLIKFSKDVPSSMWSYWTSWGRGLTLFVAIPLAAGFLLSVIFNRRISRRKVNLTLVVLLWCLAVMGVLRVLPPARVFLPFAPLYLGSASAGVCLAGAWAVKRLKQKRPGMRHFEIVFAAAVVALTSIVGLTVIVRQAPYQPDDQVRLRDARKISLFLKDRLKPGDMVYAEPNVRKPLEYYFFKEKVPSSYLYFTESGNKSRIKAQRAFVIDAGKEGYPLDAALNASNLKRKVPFHLQPVVRYPYASVYLINDPPLED
jgi:hypothetical protein